jgi:hypothetical protein
MPLTIGSGGQTVYRSTRTTLVDGYSAALQNNNRGDLSVAEAFVPQYEDNTNQVAWSAERPLAVSTSALSDGYNFTDGYAIIKASAGRLYVLYGYNSNANTRYIHIFNSTTVPGAGTGPSICLPVPGGSSFSLNLSPYGKYFATGISVANSTAMTTLTLGSTDVIFHWMYL